LLTFFNSRNLRVSKTRNGEVWSWALLPDLNRNILEKKQAISQDTFECVRLLTAVDDSSDGAAFVIDVIQHAIQLLLLLSCYQRGEPFEVNIYPRFAPLNLTIKKKEQWYPYARLLAVTSSTDECFELQYEDSYFTPLVGNFTILA
jgi:hypothetical protein